MSIKGKALSIYCATVLLFAIYLSNWGDHAYRGFAYNLGRALFWPVTVFPSLGAIVGGIVWAVVIGLLLMFVKGR